MNVEIRFQSSELDPVNEERALFSSLYSNWSSTIPLSPWAISFRQAQGSLPTLAIVYIKKVLAIVDLRMDGMMFCSHLCRCFTRPWVGRLCRKRERSNSCMNPFFREDQRDSEISIPGLRTGLGQTARTSKERPPVVDPCLRIGRLKRIFSRT